MRVVAAGQTHVGRRANNEDALLCDPELGLFVVADGMGGYEGGEVASALAIEAIHEVVRAGLRERGPLDPEPLITSASLAAHRAIVTRRTEALSRMGSTVVAALVHEGQLAVANVGDSRLYRLRAGRVQQLTTDHSTWAELAALGMGGHRAAFSRKNQITRALGIEYAHAPEVTRVALEDGDTFLLCSDGVYDPLDDATLEEALRLLPEQACTRLLDAAFAAGSSDNLTAVVFSVTQG